MTKKTLILAIDQGTTGTTCLLVDPALHVVSRYTCEFTQHFPKPGWVEHDPEEIWGSVCTAIKQVLATVDNNACEILAIGITNQRETSLVWEQTSRKPIYPAIVWQDRRTADTCRTLQQAGHASRVQELTGLVLDPYFSATKLAWILDHVDHARVAAAKGKLLAGTIDTYLTWCLSDGQVHATEPSNASRTLLWPLQGGGWSEEQCELFRVPKSILPEVRPCTALFGYTRNVPGLRDGIPIHGIVGDQQAALFGQACFAAGQAKCTYGTGAFAVLNTGSKPAFSQHGLLSSVAWQIADQTTYCLEGSAFMAGAVIQWLRDGLGLIQHAKDVEALAASVEDSEGVILVPGHVGLGAPYWRPNARGLISGLTRGTHRGHLARAALEGIALQIVDLLQAMASDTKSPIQTLKVDGGAAANNLLMQMQADFLNVPLQRPFMLEATALGAVFMAGLGVGLWNDTESLQAAWKCERQFLPQKQPEQIKAKLAAWQQAIHHASEHLEN